MFRLSNQNALITGASRGIGRQIAAQLAAAGANVILASRNLQAVEDAAAQIELEGGRARAVALDVCKQDEIEAQVGHLLDDLERIDILVNNAGITRDGLILRMKPEQWDSVLNTNLGGAFHLSKALLPSMVRRRYGRIINIASVVGQMGNPGQSNYVASKAGLIGLTKAVAREVASRGITVNAVAPGYIETDMTAGLSEKAAENLLTVIPLGRIGTVEDVAAGVLFLASKEAGYITGHVLNINGGMYM